MRRTLPVLIFSLFPIFLVAQHSPKVIEGGLIAPMMPQPSPAPVLTGPIEESVPAAVPVSFRDEEVPIGVTRFEIQSIGSLGRRVAELPGNKISAAWLYGDDQGGGWPDRGTAYNQFDGTDWGSSPNSRLEEIRSGYPSFTSTSNGLEVVISHKNTSDTQWFLQAHTKMHDETTWTETEIPSAVPGGPVWAKVATGGADGNTIHVVAVSVAPDFGGVVYEGVTQHPLYYRSTDGGATWDKVDVIIPGLDSTYYLRVAGEAYNIAAKGDTVAIAVFDAWGDIAVFKSTDNGETWNRFLVLDHPLDKYDGSGYGPGDVPYDPVPNDSISIFSSDYSGSVLIDNDGKVHVFFSMLYHYANGSEYWLNYIDDGIAYWNEEFETDELDIIAYAPDIDGDGLITRNGAPEVLRFNNTNFTSFPTSSIDDDGNMYVVYSALREDLISYEQTTYRHIFIVKSTDGGLTWSDPFDLINPSVTEFYEFIEGQYPSIQAHISDSIELVYLQDYEPGPTPENATVSEQFIMHVSINKETFEPPNNTNEVPQLNGDVVLAPNPAQHGVSVRFELVEPVVASFRVYDTLGRQVYLSKKENLPVGVNAEWLDLPELANGLYLVQMEIGGAQVNRKLVVGR